MKNKNIYSQVSGLKYHTKVKFSGLKCHTESQCVKNVSRFNVTRAEVSNKVSHNIHHSLMSAVVGEKSLVILLGMGVHIGLTLGPLCCRFMGGL